VASAIKRDWPNEAVSMSTSMAIEKGNGMNGCGTN
jgi:hypothetical protein